MIRLPQTAEQNPREVWTTSGGAGTDWSKPDE